ncbi:phage antirepressor KilAC domain-containing protein [Acetobacter senegalensis]|uniref:phage antirepressor KilAC domain-containing protein n=1 Tax=Acetobacter senegalensis TaxID=446692 RepID=UPI001EDB45BB|nr:phage antirepressor KilAC domain-containing protein [Acetobacter senegalensis]MCG4254228.1 phage antirepressor KilAC domain-containing protein [Acetobacter senegalensis]
MTSTLSILGTTIRRDAEGRFCLNDCHKASGGLKKDGPSYFLATSKAQELISKLASEGHTGKSAGPLKVVNDGINNGTYASKEVIYAYAMWINVDFHLTVIRAFDALVTGQITPPALSEQEIVAQALQITVRQVEELKAENAILAPKAEVAEKIAGSDGLYTLNLSAKAAQMPLNQFTRIAHANGFIFKQNGKWNAYSDKVKAGYCYVKFHPYRDRDGDERFSPQVFFTPKGITRLVQITGQH